MVCTAGPVFPFGERACTLLCVCGSQNFYFEKIRVFKAGNCLNTLAWNNRIGLWYYFVGFFRTEVMINRDSWGHSYSIVRGEILGFIEDELLRRHLPRMFSLIKSNSEGFENDQIPL